MIQRDHPEWSISQQCRLVQLSRSAFYDTPVGIDTDTLAMMQEIDRVFTKHPFFGSRQIAAYLRREGTVVGRLWRSLKQEAIYLEEINDGFQARRIVKDWITFHNTERPRSALERQTPGDAYRASLKEQKAA